MSQPVQAAVQAASRIAHLVDRRSKACGCELCERAAIVEFDAGQTRDEAERAAAGERR